MRYTYTILCLLICLTTYSCKTDKKGDARSSPERNAKDDPLNLENTPLKDFLFLFGEWEGEFEFVMAMKDLSTEILPAKCSVKQDQHKIKMNYTYESNGRTVPDNQEVFHDVSRGIFFGGNYNAIESVERNGENVSILLTRVGSENRKPADIRTTLNFDGQVLKIIKKAKPENKSEFTFRNSYTLNKIK